MNILNNTGIAQIFIYWIYSLHVSLWVASSGLKAKHVDFRPNKWISVQVLHCLVSSPVTDFKIIPDYLHLFRSSTGIAPCTLQREQDPDLLWLSPYRDYSLIDISTLSRVLTNNKENECVIKFEMYFEVEFSIFFVEETNKIPGA